MAKLDKTPRRNAFNVIAADSVDDNKVSILSNNRIEQKASAILNKANVNKAVTIPIHREIIYPNPLNKKYMDKMTEAKFRAMKFSILTEGLFHNLVVLDDGQGKYRLISGEKRWTSIGMMTPEEYYSNFPDGIDAKVLRYDTPLTQEEEYILLLTCNVITFSNGTPDPEQVRDLIQLYKNKGYEKNELVEYLKAHMEESQSTFYKLIGEAQAIPELYDLYKKDVMTRSALQCLGGLDEPEQKKVYEKIINEGIDKIDQQLAFDMKKDFKVVKSKRRKKTSDSTNVDQSISFKKYTKSIDDFSSLIEKNEKIKLDVMSEMELEYTSSKLENIINKMLAQKSKIDAKANEKKNK